MRSRFNPLGLSPPSRLHRAPRNLRSDRSSRRPLVVLRKPAPEQDRSAWQQTLEPVPGQDHPIHNSALRPAWGHHMYSTGKFDLQTPGCAHGMLKLYSHGPIDESQADHRKLCRLFRENTRLLSGSAWSVCYYLYLIALESLRSLESSRDAHSQIFSPPGERMPSLTIPSARRLVGRARTWNLSCRLGKSADGHNILSRPWISFQAFPAQISQWCSVATASAVPQPMFLFLVIAGSLKANSNQDPNHAPLPQYTDRGAFQSIADDLAIQCMRAVIDQKPFESADAVMTAIRKGLLSYLPSSPIASALDLSYLGISMQFGIYKRRLVQNVLLNHDGSLKTNREMPLFLPSLEANSAIGPPSGNGDRQPNIEVSVPSSADSAEASQGTERTLSTTETHEEKAEFWKFSESLHRKLGMNFTWRFKNLPKDPPVEKQRLALQRLERQCQGLDASGIALLATGTSRLFEASPSSSSINLRGFPRLFLPSSFSGSATNHASIVATRELPWMKRWHSNAPISVYCRPSHSWFGIRLPGILGIPVKLGDGDRSLHVLIFLTARVSNAEDMPWDGGCSATITDEISFLGKAADVVIRRTIQATTFESLKSCASTIAEAIIRFLRFRSLSLPLSSVWLQACADDGLGKFRFATTRKNRQLDVSTEGIPTPRTAAGDTTRPDTESAGKVAGDHADESEAISDVLESCESTSAESDVIAVNAATVTENEHARTDLDNTEAVGGCQSERTSLSNLISTDDGRDTKRTRDKDAKSNTVAVQRGFMASATWRNGFGLRMPKFICKLTFHESILEHTVFLFCKCAAFWTPLHTSTLANAPSGTIISIVNRTISQSKMGSMRDLLSVTEHVMAAIPFEPWKLRLIVTMADESFIKGHSKQSPISIHVNLERSLFTGGTKKEEPECGTSKIISIFLPCLRFTTPDTEAFLTFKLVGTLPVERLVSTDINQSTGTTILAQVKDICEAVRAIVSPCLADMTPDTMDDVAWATIPRAILDSEQPLAGLLHVGTAQLMLGEWNDKKLENPRCTFASIPGARFPAHPYHRIYIALGSNVGDRVESIESACRCLDEHADIRVVETSPLYETEPMYVANQDSFLNGVCEIVTSVDPVELLNYLQAIEKDLGRHKTIDKGPRNIDLDILAYGETTMTTERLTVPHAQMLEREFVLRPLCDTVGAEWVHPSTDRMAIDHLREIQRSNTTMHPLTCLGAGLEPLRPLHPKRKTQVMSILNVTPDSFSDGGVNKSSDLEALRVSILSNIAAGATIIDIGGQSSRPNAEDVSSEEEISRILPAIALIKSLPEAKGIAISVDTYRAAVAEAAINAGAHIINDISAGLLDPNMLPTIARLGCTYIMMHMRGTPATMQNEENTSYPDGLITTIVYELSLRLEAAQKAGIRRWRIILDPGIGFAKTWEQNVELLRDFSKLRDHKYLQTYPWLVGTSRKGFIGKITGVANAKDRASGTAATITAAVQAGAEIVRVHDVKEMAEVVQMANAMYRM